MAASSPPAKAAASHRYIAYRPDPSHEFFQRKSATFRWPPATYPHDRSDQDSVNDVSVTGGSLAASSQSKSEVVSLGGKVFTPVPPNRRNPWDASHNGSLTFPLPDEAGFVSVTKNADVLGSRPSGSQRKPPHPTSSRNDRYYAQLFELDKIREDKVESHRSARAPSGNVPERSAQENGTDRSSIGSSQHSPPRSSCSHPPRLAQSLSRRSSTGARKSRVWNWIDRVLSPTPSESRPFPHPVSPNSSRRASTTSATKFKPYLPANPSPIPFPPASAVKSLQRRLECRSDSSTRSKSTVLSRQGSVTSAGSWARRCLASLRRTGNFRRTFDPRQSDSAQSVAALPDSISARYDSWGNKKGGSNGLAGSVEWKLPDDGCEAAEQYWNHLKEERQSTKDRRTFRAQSIRSARSVVSRVFSPVYPSMRHRLRNDRDRVALNLSDQCFSPVSPLSSASRFSFDSGASQKDFTAISRPTTARSQIPNRQMLFEDTAECGPHIPLDQYLQSGDLSELPKSRYPAKEIPWRDDSSVDSAITGKTKGMSHSLASLASCVKRKFGARPGGNKLRKRKSQGSNPYNSDADSIGRRWSTTLVGRSSYSGSTRRGSARSSIKSAKSVFSAIGSALKLKRNDGLSWSVRKSRKSEWFPKSGKLLTKPPPASRPGRSGSSVTGRSVKAG